MKAAYTREMKSFGIVPARKPQEGYSVAGVVVIADREGRGCVCVKFHPALEIAVGRALPYGVGPDTPAYIKAVEMPGDHHWRVFAHYMDGTKSRLLWTSKEKPLWIKKIRRSDSGADT